MAETVEPGGAAVNRGTTEMAVLIGRILVDERGLTATGRDGAGRSGEPRRCTGSAPSSKRGARGVARVPSTTAQIVRALVREWRDDGVSGLAAEVAFFALLSFFPALLATTTAVGYLEALFGRRVAERATDEVVGFLSQILTEEAQPAIAAVRQLFGQERSGLFTIGLLGALWAASRAFVGAIRALDRAYDLEERRSFVQTRVIALSLAVGTIVVVAVALAMLVLGPFLGTGQELAEAIGLGAVFATFWEWFRWPVTVALLTVWGSIVFHVAPFHRTPWRWDLPGAAVTTALWVLASVGLRFYVELAASRNPVLGTLGGALILVIWLYLLAIGLLIGGELNAVLVERYGVRQEAGRRWSLRGVLQRLRGALAGRG